VFGPRVQAIRFRSLSGPVCCWAVGAETGLWLDSQTSVQCSTPTSGAVQMELLRVGGLSLVDWVLCR